MFSFNELYSWRKIWKRPSFCTKSKMPEIPTPAWCHRWTTVIYFLFGGCILYKYTLHITLNFRTTGPREKVHRRKYGHFRCSSGKERTEYCSGYGKHLFFVTTDSIWNNYCKATTPGTTIFSLPSGIELGLKCVLRAIDFGTYIEGMQTCAWGGTWPP